MLVLNPYFFIIILNISALSSSSGNKTGIFLSNLPALFRAASKRSGLFVAE